MLTNEVVAQAQAGQDRRVFPLEAPDDILAVAYRVAVEGFHLVVVRVLCHADVPPYADNLTDSTPDANSRRLYSPLSSTPMLHPVPTREDVTDPWASPTFLSAIQIFVLFCFERH